MSNRYREIEVAGGCREMGRQIGELVGDELRGFVEASLALVNKTTPVTRERAARIADGCLQRTSRYAPHLIEELEGMGEAAGVPLQELMMLQVRNQFGAGVCADSGCTALAVSAEAAGGEPIVAQNWDNDPALDPFTIVLTRRPADGPASMTVTQAGLISYIGFNSAGIGACVNTLPAPSREVGVPHYFTLRELYRAASLDEAVGAVRRADEAGGRAIPANIVLSTPEGPADLEVTIDDVRVLRDDAGVVTHTNHCLHPELIEVNERFDELIESRPRKARIDELCRERPLNAAAVQAALADHQGHPRSICRHANDDPNHGFWETVFSIVVEPQAKRMHVSRGTPCCQPFETYEL